MSQTMPALSTKLDDQAALYLARIRQIDRIIEGPIMSLISVAAQGHVPTWFSPEVATIEEDSRLTEAISCATLQKLWRLRRRFSWLDIKRLEEARKLVNKFVPEDHGFYECVRLLESKAFGGLNPLTASQVFRILLNAGEKKAHSGIGFLAFFAIIWPLSRRFPSQLTIGARIEPWDVTAYVTAKCLLPIRDLQRIIEERAQLYDDIADNLIELSHLKASPDRNDPKRKWLFNIEVDDLCANLSHLSQRSIDRDAFQICEQGIQKLSTTDDPQVIYDKILELLEVALKQIRIVSSSVLKDARDVVKLIKTKILIPLRANQNETERFGEAAKLDSSLTNGLMMLKFAGEHDRNCRYWEDLADAAETSIAYCQRALLELQVACKICPDVKRKRETRHRNITKALKKLASANRKVKDVLNEPVLDAALWCRNIVDREIAHASAQNFTEFDPSELVSAIAVAVGWNVMSTSLQVSDAVTKAIAGARKDGSWRSGKPFYSPDHAFGIWASTSDIVCTLTSAIEQFPGVTDADKEFFNFVDWLERTQIKLRATSAHKGSTKNSPDRLLHEYIGWASERLRDRRTINFGTTAHSINALLQIRDLAEYRLWELCKKRFSVISVDKALREIDPVDLGAEHTQRLHRRLEQIAYKAKKDDTRAEYSLVLHGPPGSSKTKLAEALSTEMWRFANRWGPREHRLIRITPADFTRMGEDRLDSEARAIFDLITGVRGVTVFFDEIDDLLRQRNTGQERPRFMDLVVPAMLNRLADLRTACPRQELCFILATNYVENIDSALIRKGRIDASFPVVYPDFMSRMAIAIGVLHERFRKVNLSNDQALQCCQLIARGTAQWPYLAILSLCRGLEPQIEDGMSDLLFATYLKAGIAEAGSSFSKAAYHQRWKHVTRYSQELLNEYLHHLISEREDAHDCCAGDIDEHIRERIAKLSSENVQKTDEQIKKEIDGMFAAILKKEGQIT
jgi:ATPase family protein associated with various cellular activities (AAA)